MRTEGRVYTAVEELLHSGLHGAGAIVFFALTAFLVARSRGLGSAAALAALLYGASVVATFSASFLFHSASHGTRTRAVLEVFDHSAIYFMILGTYLPILLIRLDDTVGYVLFALCATCAVAGAAVSVINLGALRSVGFALYIGAAFFVILALLLHPHKVGSEGGMLLLGGVICYTGGIFFYRRRELKYMHVAWHALVLAGSLFHFFAILGICYS